MASFWFIAGVDSDWNTNGNWSATEGGASNGGTPSASDDVYFSDTSSAADCTMSANSVCLSIQTDSAQTSGTDNYTGTLTDGGFTVGVSGNILLGTALTIVSTGVWTQLASGNITNTVEANCIFSFITSAGNTSTLTASFHAGYLDIVATSTITGGPGFELHADWNCDGVVTTHVIINGTVSVAVLHLIGISGSGTTSNGFTIGSNLKISHQNGNLAFTADVNLGGNSLFVDGVNSTSEAASGRMTMNASTTLTCGDINLGIDTATPDRGGGKLILGFEANIVASGNLAVADNSNGWIDSGSSSIFTMGGSMALLGLTPGSAFTDHANPCTINFTASTGSPTVDFDGSTVGHIVVNNSGVTSFINQSDFVCESLTITAGVFDISTYTVTSSNATSVTGEFKIGASASTGFTTAGLTFVTGCTRTWLTTSKVTNSGNYVSPNEAFSTTAKAGIYTQTATGSYTSSNVNNQMQTMTIDLGATLTITGVINTNTWTVEGAVVIDNTTHTIESAYGAGSWTASTGAIVRFNNTNATSGTKTLVTFVAFPAKADWGGWLSNAEIANGRLFIQDIAPAHLMTYQDTGGNASLGAGDALSVEFDGTPDLPMLWKGMTTGIFKTSGGKVCVTNRPGTKTTAVIGGITSSLNVSGGCLAVNTAGTLTSNVLLEGRKTSLNSDGSGNLCVTVSLT